MYLYKVSVTMAPLAKFLLSSIIVPLVPIGLV